MIKEQKKSLLRRRKIYTIVAALLVIVLIPTLITITYLSRNKSFEDIDGTAYKIKYSGGVYENRLIVGRGIGNAHRIPRINNTPEVIKLVLNPKGDK